MVLCAAGITAMALVAVWRSRVGSTGLPLRAGTAPPAVPIDRTGVIAVGDGDFTVLEVGLSTASSATHWCGEAVSLDGRLLGRFRFSSKGVARTGPLRDRAVRLRLYASGDVAHPVLDRVVDGLTPGTVSTTFNVTAPAIGRRVIVIDSGRWPVADATVRVGGETYRSDWSGAFLLARESAESHGTLEPPTGSTVAAAIPFDLQPSGDTFVQFPKGDESEVEISFAPPPSPDAVCQVVILPEGRPLDLARRKIVPSGRPGTRVALPPGRYQVWLQCDLHATDAIELSMRHDATPARIEFREWRDAAVSLVTDAQSPGDIDINAASIILSDCTWAAASRPGWLPSGIDPGDEELQVIPFDVIGPDERATARQRTVLVPPVECRVVFCDRNWCASYCVRPSEHGGTRRLVLRPVAESAKLRMSADLGSDVRTAIAGPVVGLRDMNLGSVISCVPGIVSFRMSRLTRPDRRAGMRWEWTGEWRNVAVGPGETYEIGLE